MADESRLLNRVLSARSIPISFWLVVNRGGHHRVGGGGSKDEN